MKDFFKELKKRNVYKVATAYVVFGWLAMQVLDTMGNNLGWSNEIASWITKVLIAGFPIALVLAWVYELTPQGIKKTGAVQAETSVNKKVGRRLNQFIIGVLALALCFLLIERLFFASGRTVLTKSEATIAVLPFRNDSPDKENLYFCDGITEGVRQNLSKIPSLSVVSRTSVEQYRENPPSMAVIAKDLGVNYILEGSVLRLENRSVIHARLIFAPEDRNLWSTQYNRDLEDVFSVLAEVTSNIADELEATISPEVMQNIVREPTDDITAYDYYLQAKGLEKDSLLGRGFVGDLDRADSLYQLALYRDPNFAKAFVERVRIFRQKHQFEFFDKQSLLDSMLYLCDKAIALDSNLADAYWVRGAFYDDFLYDIPKAVEDLNRALELNPNHVEAIGQLAVLKWAHLREIIPALKLYRKMEKLEHSDEVLFGAHITLSQLYWNIWDHDKGYQYLDKAIAVNPGLNGLKAWFYIQEGRYSEAVELMKDSQDFAALGFLHLLTKEYEKALGYYRKWGDQVKAEGVQEIAELESWHRYGQVLVGLGRKKEGEELMQYQLELNEKLQEKYQRAHQVLYESAGIYSFLGDEEKALEHLMKFDSINRWDDGKLHFIQRDPQFDNIRETEEFKAIVNKRMADIQQAREEVSRLEAAGEL